jgi:hypothetical protein
MTCRPCRGARERSQPPAGQRQLGRQIRREQAGVAEAGPDGFPGRPVKIDPELRSLERAQALGQQGPDRPGQHIARTAAREGRVLER